MSSSSNTTSSPSLPAPWRSEFLDHVWKLDPPTFMLSTIRRVSPSHPVGGAVGYVPRARTCVLRGMWAELPGNSKNDAPKNPGVFGSDLPVFTTDVRMEKMSELWDPAATEDYAAHEKREWRGTGGGGPVEAVWWVDETKTQWRLRGRAYVLGPDAEESESGRKVTELLRGQMRAREESPAGQEEWSFAREVTAHFGNLSPMMRGSFKNPPPGTPIVTNPDPDNLDMGQKVTGLDDKVARENFRVVVIVPQEVDQCFLPTGEPAKRYNFTFRGNNARPTTPGGEIIGQWEKVELWP